MTHLFPPLEWFEAGATSHRIVSLVMCLVIVAMVGSILACWFWPSKLRRMWVLAELFWIAASIGGILTIATSPSSSITPLFRDQSLILLIPTLLALTVLAPSAVLAGWRQLSANPQDSIGFRNIKLWVITTLICLIGLASNMMPTFEQPREAARKSLCKHNLKGIFAAMRRYHDSQEKFPDSQTTVGDLPPVSWRVLLDFTEANFGLPVAQYDRTKTWDAPENLATAKSRCFNLICPSVPEKTSHDPAGRYFTSYAFLTGPGTAFPNGVGLPLSAFTDGTATTALVVEACDQQIVWTEPRDVELTNQNIGINRTGHPSSAWSSHHNGRVHTLFADGAVRSLSEKTDPRVLRAITTPASGDSLNGN